MKKFLIALSVCAGSSASAKTCEWNGGQNPFKGSPLFAVLGYEDIPIWPRLLLAVRVGKAAPTDQIKIHKDRIESSEGHQYQPGIYAMYFGNAKMCDEVKMDHWPVEKFEPAPVWCVEWAGMPWCVAVPTVCNNVSLVFRHKEREVYPDAVRQVPEPSGIYLTLLALGIALFAKRSRNRGHRKTRGAPPDPR